MLMLKINFPRFLLAFYIPTINLIFILLISPNPYTYAQFQENFTSRCDQNGNCTTTICVNDQPCKTTTSNSTNSTSMDNFLQNKTIPAPMMPRELI